MGIFMMIMTIMAAVSDSLVHSSCDDVDENFIVIHMIASNAIISYCHHNIIMITMIVITMIIMIIMIMIIFGAFQCEQKP